MNACAHHFDQKDQLNGCRVRQVPGDDDVTWWLVLSILHESIQVPS